MRSSSVTENACGSGSDMRPSVESGPLVRFACGLRRDFSAIVAAAETEWSSGQVEGQINRLKTIKRQMYGRAGFSLLRARVLPVLPCVAPSPP
jgi:transposase